MFVQMRSPQARARMLEWVRAHVCVSARCNSSLHFHCLPLPLLLLFGLQASCVLGAVLRHAADCWRVPGGVLKCCTTHAFPR
jgi:hypothetical protein